MNASRCGGYAMAWEGGAKVASGRRCMKVMERVG